MNKKAFTLIELLAVLTIMAIIALIAIPKIKGIIENSKEASFKNKLDTIEKKVQEKCYLEQERLEEITTSYNITDNIISPSINLEGKIPNGDINVDDKCNVTYSLSDGDYLGTKEKIDGLLVITKLKKAEDIKNFVYKEKLLSGTDPVIEDGMIPVVLDNDGTVKKADLSKEWYNYENKKWANVVLVNESSRARYINLKADSVIKQDDVLAYLVWIPRYKYAIPSGSGARTIDILFENNKTSKSTGSAVDKSYLTHPGFTFGDKELNGMWVGKFETTIDPNSACGASQNETNCKNVIPSILPNIVALRNQTLDTEIKTAAKFQSNTFGITKEVRILKNTEWGAIAYLTESIYGINKNVRINNNSSYITGCGALDGTTSITSECDNNYGSNIENYPQSTTGNITGIFDMSGGSNERVMANFTNSISSAGLSSMPESKYYNLYSSNDYTSACNNSNCNGHAINETQKWYENKYEDLTSTNSWVLRGGSYDTANNTGLFGFIGRDGKATPYRSFRIVIIN